MDSEEGEGSARLIGLADAVFAIAMTLLALDLRVPDLGAQPSDHALTRALFDQSSHYVAFLISFFVIAGYWQRHKSEMCAADAGHPAIVRRTLPLLLAVCALPFAASLLGTYGTHDGIAIAVYAAVNIVAVSSLIALRQVVTQHRGVPRVSAEPQSPELWFDLAALVLAAPSGYAFPGHGPLILVTLLLAGSAAGSAVNRLRKPSTA